MGIITRDDAPFMISFAQLETKNVAAAREYAPTLFLQRDYPDIHLILTDNIADALHLVSKGDAFCRSR